MGGRASADFGEFLAPNGAWEIDGEPYTVAPGSRFRWFGGTQAKASILTVLLWVLIWQAPLLLVHALHGPQDVVAEALSGETSVFGAIFSFFSRMAVDRIKT